MLTLCIMCCLEEERERQEECRRERIAAAIREDQHRHQMAATHPPPGYPYGLAPQPLPNQSQPFQYRWPPVPETTFQAIPAGILQQAHGAMPMYKRQELTPEQQRESNLRMIERSNETARRDREINEISAAANRHPFPKPARRTLPMRVAAWGRPSNPYSRFENEEESEPPPPYCE